MRIGVGAGGRTVARAREYVEAAAAEGFASAWFNNIFGLDAITTCALVGAAVPIELGTLVTPVQPRHPHAVAQQAATAYDACDGRFVLGLGLSHKVMIADMLGLPWDKPAGYMREYLEVLMPLLETGSVSHTGDAFRVNTLLERPREGRPPVVIAALGPRMLEIAGQMADGTATWMTGPRTLADHTVPALVAATEAAGRPAPRVVAALPVCVTNDVDAARERAAKDFAHYGTLPSYRAMLDREGVEGPAGVAIVGDEEAVADGLRTVAEAGVTDFVAGIFGDPAERTRTRGLLLSLAGA